jgi:acyl-CoA thioester hydrolase
MSIEYPIKTRYAETGQDGIIHHSSYILYFEAARIEFLSSLGFDINFMETQGIFCPVVSIDAHYVKPLRSLQDITVKVSIYHFSKVRFQIMHEIFFQGDKMAYALSHHCFINSHFKPIAIPSSLAKKFKEILSS